ncbi:hypothetical protein E2C01_044942 [Portunus trituberculatus]|uniref:Uncharacterized protein n=1 Tax=Portunus trituberculatus TaxID=210409 RepID=A0A5B7G1H7_PORTR|nr:hypothetical protein [Portunus trituberculatus]
MSMRKMAVKEGKGEEDVSRFSVSAYFQICAYSKRRAASLGRRRLAAAAMVTAAAEAAQQGGKQSRKLRNTIY